MNTTDSAPHLRVRINFRSRSTGDCYGMAIAAGPTAGTIRVRRRGRYPVGDQHRTLTSWSDTGKRQFVIYLTQRRLMVESETTIHHVASSNGLGSSRVCRQLVNDPARYSLWHVSHDRRMSTVAERLERERQILALRAVYLEQVHRAALVRYLRNNNVIGEFRDMTLQAFYGLMDPRRAAVAEHKSYLISASSQLCTYHLLKLAGDLRGLSLIQDYQGSYGQFFGMFCDNARAAREGSTYLLRSLLPDARAEADALRKRILGGDRLPSRPVSVKTARQQAQPRVFASLR